MGKPLSFETEITKKRIIDAIEEMEADLRTGEDQDVVERKLSELRIALESKPVVDSVR